MKYAISTYLHIFPYRLISMAGRYGYIVGLVIQWIIGFI